MGRSGYDEDVDDGGLWRGAVKQALNGRRGQAFLMELRATLGHMPKRELIAGELISRDGECCALGSVFQARGIDCSGIDPEDPSSIAQRLGIASAMVQEIEFLNDDDFCYRDSDETASHRWERMYKWVCGKIRP